MDYMVVAPDGQEYGPANVDTLRQWATENRLGPDTMLKDFMSGQKVQASTVPGIFPAQSSAPPLVAQPQYAAPGPAGANPNWSQPPQYYGRPQGRPTAYSGYDSGAGDIWGAAIRAVLAIFLFFVFRYAGLITAAYGVLAAIRAQQKGHKFGWVAILISVLVLAGIGIGWMLRLGGGAL